MKRVGEFQTTLVTMRRERRLSQLALAAMTGLSQRHVSFLESGRAKPGPRSLRKLIVGLSLSQPETAMLLAAARLSSDLPSPDWHAACFANARSVATMLLDRHMPYPALITARDGTVLQHNAAYSRLIAAADQAGELSRLASNLYNLTLHPDGLPKLMINPQAIIAHTLYRLRRAASSDPASAQVLQRLMQFDHVRDAVFRGPPADDAGVVLEVYRLGPNEVTLVTMTAAFSYPETTLAQQVAVELFFPVDQSTAVLLKQIGGT